MIGHLGARVSDLLDGRLLPEEEERAWRHVHQCHQCRDQVEREGWVKTQLAALAWSAADAPRDLKGLLLTPAGLSPAEPYLTAPTARGRTRNGMALVGSSALGVAVLGILALPASPAAAPAMEGRAVPASVSRSSGGPLSIAGAFADLKRSLESMQASRSAHPRDKMGR